MSERLTDAERRALLAGDDAESLAPEEVAELGIVADVLADPSSWVEPDPSLEDRVLRAVADAAPVVAPAPVPTASAAPARARRTHDHRGRRFMTAAVGVAASVALVVGALAVSGSDGVSPDFQARLTATSLAPHARAAADVTRNAAGFRIELDAHGLRRLHDGAYYQAWLKNVHGGLVSIGTFSSSAGAIVLWSGVDPREYRGITVTIEPDDDNPASSGRRVLVGAMRAS